jgi:hypothetical protein
MHHAVPLLCAIPEERALYFLPADSSSSPRAAAVAIVTILLDAQGDIMEIVFMGDRSLSLAIKSRS